MHVYVRLAYVNPKPHFRSDMKLSKVLIYFVQTRLGGEF